MDDVFTRLPNDILHHVISLLPLKEAVGTTLISRSWRRAWSSYPQFHFDFNDFIPDHDDEPSWFHGYIDTTLSRLREQRVLLPKLIIRTWNVKSRPETPAFLDRWIGMALDDRAWDLELILYYNGCSDNTRYYTLPDRVLASDFIKTLILEGEQIRIVHSFNDVSLSSLQSLKFGAITISNEMLKTLLQSCLSLEILVLNHCRTLTQIIISGLSHLKSLEIRRNQRDLIVHGIKIEAPALEIFHYDDAIFSPNDIGSPIPVLNRCPKLMELELWHNKITQEAFQEWLENAPLLERLKINNCFGLRKIWVSNPLVQKIEIEDSEGLMDIKINTRKLSSLHVLNLPLMRIRSACPLPNCEVTIGFALNSEHDANQFIEIMQYITGSFKLKSLHLYVNYWFEGELLRRFTSSILPCYIERLQVESEPYSVNQATVLDGLLSIFRPATLHLFECCHEESFTEFLLKKFRQRAADADCCCHTGRKNCWLHQLKGVEIESFQDELLGDYEEPDWCTLFDDLLPWLNEGSICFRLKW